MDVDAPDDLCCIVEFAEARFTKVLNQLINNDLCSWSLWNIQHSQTSIYGHDLVHLRMLMHLRMSVALKDYS